MSQDYAPSRAQIEWTIAGILRRIVSGATLPRSGLRELVAVHHSAPEAQNTRFVGDEFGIAQLIGYCYGYDDLEERPAEVSFEGRFGAQARMALNDEVVRLASVWLAARGT